MIDTIILHPENEEWLPITIPNIVKPNYCISNTGKVRNIKTGKLLTPTLNKRTGYLYVSLPTNIRYEKKQIK